MARDELRHPALDRMQIRRAFDRAAPRYDEVAVLQTRVREQLLSRLDLVKITPALAVDVGCGTAHAAEALARRYPRSRVLGIDLAEGMLRTAAELHSCTICVLPDLGRAYEAVGKADAAIGVYERYVATPWFWRYETDALELGPALERLAALYDAAGEREKANGARTRLVRLWRSADAELQPAVARARAGAGSEAR